MRCRLAAVLRERTVVQELADRSMLIHKLMDTVKVTTKPLFEDTHHQDPPQLHPRTSHVAIGARQNVLLQQREELLAGLLVRIQMLETKEYRWNVIAGLMIQLDVLDPCLTGCELRFPCLSQLMSVVRRLPTMGGLGRKFLHKLPDMEFLRYLESPFIRLDSDRYLFYGKHWLRRTPSVLRPKS